VLTKENVTAERERAPHARRDLVIVGLLGLAVRVTYLLGWKHPITIGGDAYWYHYGANLLATGHGFIDAYRYHRGIVAQTADHPPLTILYLAAASVLGAKSFFWHQLEMCALGAGTVVVIAITARQLAGRTAGLIAGVVAAVYPYLWLNDPEVMSETVVQFTTAIAVLAAYAWWAKPTMKRAVLLGVTVALCALARAEAVLYIPLLAAPLILLDRRHPWRERLRQVIVASVVACAVLAPWVTFNMLRFQQPVTISTGLDPTLAVSNCNRVYYGSILGYWSQPCILADPVPTHGDVSTQEKFYREIAIKYIEAHESRLPVVVAARLGRTWGLFRPIQQIHLDRIEGKELYFGAVGLGMYYLLAIGTIAGLWIMRRRRMPLSPILATIATVTFATAITFGQTRYRAAAEPVLILAAAIAASALWDHLRNQHGERGTASAEPVAATPVPIANEPATIGSEMRALPGKRTATFPCFDGLRAIAAVSVIFVHTSFPSGLTTRHPLIGDFTARLEIGVAVFFVISGFLLYRPFAAAHLSGRPGPAIRPYLKRRILRIVPAYWVALAISAYVLHTTGRPLDNLAAIIVYFGFLQIYFSHYILGGISAAWTLCVEMTFYAFLPIYGAILAAARRRPLQTQVVGLVSLFAISLAWKIAIYAHPTTQQTGAGTWLPAELDLFALGMALAVANVWWAQHESEPEWLSRPWFPAACWGGALASFILVSSIGLPRVPLYTEHLGSALAKQWLYGAFGVLLVLPAVFGPQDRGWVRALLRSRPFVAVGMVSYGIYLWHEPWILKVIQWSHRPLFDQSFWWMTGIVAVLTAACAAASWWLVEQPFQRLGRPQRPAAVAREPAPSFSG